MSRLRIKTTCRPISAEHSSVVDLVRRNPAPPYSRTSRWAIWTEPGGVVWALVWVRISVFLVIFGVVGGYSPPIHRGVSYDIPLPRLTLSDVQHLRIGGAITDRAGEMLIDPAVDELVFVSVSRSGEMTIENRGHKADGEASRTVAVLQADRNAAYASVVSALDAIKQREPPVEDIWIAALADAEPYD